MANKTSKTMLVRVDKDIWKQCTELFPGESGPTISRLLYNNSLVKVEKILKDKDFINKTGRILYGKRSWNSAFGGRKRNI